ncbi:MAG: DUF3592 domain-containing protein [Pseudomonadota bacterium]
MQVQRKHERDRPRGWFSLYVRLGGWASLAAAGVLVLVSGISLGLERRAHQYETQGVLADAEITRLWVEVDVDSDGDRTTTHYAAFRYSAGQRTIERDRSVSRSYFFRASEGDWVPIRYLADRPDRFEYRVGQTAENASWALWVGWITGGLGLGVLALIGAQTNRAYLARERGEMLTAEVTGVLETGVSVNNEKRVRLHWRAPDGAVGQSLMTKAFRLAAYRPGDQITVFRGAKRMWWEGDVGARRR